jgi:hypothetical protein
LIEETLILNARGTEEWRSGGSYSSFKSVFPSRADSRPARVAGNGTTELTLADSQSTMKVDARSIGTTSAEFLLIMRMLALISSEQRSGELELGQTR